MNTQNDFLDNAGNAELDIDSTENLNAEMCSFMQSDMEKMCSSLRSDTHRDCGVDTKERYLEILEFTHFVQFFSFNSVDKNHKEKEFVMKITVVVALDLGCGNTKSFENESE